MSCITASGCDSGERIWKPMMSDSPSLRKAGYPLSSVILYHIMMQFEVESTLYELQVSCHISAKCQMEYDQFTHAILTEQPMSSLCGSQVWRSLQLKLVSFSKSIFQTNDSNLWKSFALKVSTLWKRWISRTNSQIMSYCWCVHSGVLTPYSYENSWWHGVSLCDSNVHGDSGLIKEMCTRTGFRLLYWWTQHPPHYQCEATNNETHLWFVIILIRWLRSAWAPGRLLRQLGSL